ncbi:hypothetical protein PIB30_032310, partial [Stylosanthes scabra]|nr:hypothetical protein [Stylosanthes scabra]
MLMGSFHTLTSQWTHCRASLLQSNSLERVRLDLRATGAVNAHSSRGGDLAASGHASRGDDVAPLDDVSASGTLPEAMTWR